MPATGGLLPIAGILILAGLIGRKPKRKKTTVSDTPCPPFPFMAARIDPVIERIIDTTGLEDVDVIALQVAQEVYPEHDGKPLTWPPPSGATAQDCILGQISIRANLILAQLADERVNVPEPVGPPGPLDWPSEVTEWSASEPNHGFWYQVVEDDDGLSDIAQRAVKNALIEAGRDPSLALARDATGRRLIVDAMNSIECAPINDGLYGTEDAHHYAPHGRGISLNRVHADNLDRMRKGEAPRRSVITKRRHDGTGGYLPALWIPRWNLEALREPEPRIEVESEGFWPENGLSGSWPPPPFTDLGAVNVPSGGWGCDPWTSEIPAGRS